MVETKCRSPKINKNFNFSRFLCFFFFVFCHVDNNKCVLATRTIAAYLNIVAFLNPDRYTVFDSGAPRRSRRILNEK